jgi:membrane protein implicated in regulation of membrane protease activity
MESLDKIVFWHWFVVATLIMCIELFAPTAFFLWCGIAAAMVGVVLLVIPGMSWELQFILFAVLCVVSVIIGRSVLKKQNIMASDQPTLNRRGEQYIGRVFTLNENIVDGTGRINVDDGSWRVEGKDMTSGSKVKVTAVNGATLVVEAI